MNPPPQNARMTPAERQAALARTKSTVEPTGPVRPTEVKAKAQGQPTTYTVDESSSFMAQWFMTISSPDVDNPSVHYRTTLTTADPALVGLAVGQTLTITVTAPPVDPTPPSDEVAIHHGDANPEAAAEELALRHPGKQGDTGPGEAVA